MKAFLIDACEQTIEPIEIEASLDAIRHSVGFDTIESDDVDGGGPDESSLRGPEISLEELRRRVKFS